MTGARSGTSEEGEDLLLYGIYIAVILPAPSRFKFLPSLAEGRHRHWATRVRTPTSNQAPSALPVSPIHSSRVVLEIFRLGYRSRLSLSTSTPQLPHGLFKAYILNEIMMIY